MKRQGNTLLGTSVIITRILKSLARVGVIVFFNTILDWMVRADDGTSVTVKRV